MAKNESFSKDEIKNRYNLRIKESIQTIDADLKNLNNVIKEQNDLHAKLLCFPDKLRYDAMIPIGSVAFFSGNLIRTNEILLLLGDNWYANVSAKKAATIISLRIVALEERREKRVKEKELVVNRRQFVESEMNDGVVEIVEEFDEEREEKWRNERKQKKKKKEEAAILKDEAVSDDIVERLVTVVTKENVVTHHPSSKPISQFKKSRQN